MRILYGVVGEGMGHAIRSAVVLEKLVADGHEIHIVASGRAHGFLGERFRNVDRIWGLTMATEDNEVKKRLTARDNFLGALEGLPSNVRRYFEVVRKYSPEVVISDFESFSWLFARVHGLPLVCIDNIQILNRCRHDERLIGEDRGDFDLARSIVKAKAPWASHYLITTFFYPEIRKKRTTLVPPILRASVLETEPDDGDHLLVYQTSPSFASLIPVLARQERPVHIYGMRRDIQEDVVEGNLVFRPFSDQGFVDDLASCAAVVGSAGFTLIGEALHFGKPYLATPVRDQFEQLLNARYIEDLGYGICAEDLDGPTLSGFLEELETYRATLQGYERHDNSQLFEELDGLLDRAAADLLRRPTVPGF
jgi:uncharacterized protein (TIGR00661 family)